MVVAAGVEPAWPPTGGDHGEGQCYTLDWPSYTPRFAALARGPVAQVRHLGCRTRVWLACFAFAGLAPRPTATRLRAVVLGQAAPAGFAPR